MSGLERQSPLTASDQFVIRPMAAMWQWRDGLCFLVPPLGGRLVEERCTFLVCRSDAPPSGVSAGGARGSNGDGQHEEDSHDDKGKDPLECNDLALELSDSNCGGQDAESEAHGVVLDWKTIISCLFWQSKKK